MQNEYGSDEYLKKHLESRILMRKELQQMYLYIKYFESYGCFMEKLAAMVLKIIVFYGNFISGLFPTLNHENAAMEILGQN